jgi:hypothetical protein
VTTYTCPKGHASSTDDFCDVCGAKIGGTMPITLPAAVSTPGSYTHLTLPTTSRV